MHERTDVLKEQKVRLRRTDGRSDRRADVKIDRTLLTFVQTCCRKTDGWSDRRLIRRTCGQTIRLYDRRTDEEMQRRSALVSGRMGGRTNAGGWTFIGRCIRWTEDLDTNDEWTIRNIRQQTDDTSIGRKVLDGGMNGLSAWRSMTCSIDRRHSAKLTNDERMQEDQ